jgi:HEAT repeat protein
VISLLTQDGILAAPIDALARLGQWAFAAETFLLVSSCLCLLHVALAVRRRASVARRAPTGLSPRAAQSPPIKGLSSTRPEVRRSSLEELDRGATPESVAAAGRLLGDPVPEVAEAAANALGRIGGQQALSLLLDADAGVQLPMPTASREGPPLLVSVPAPADEDSLPPEDTGRPALRLSDPLSRSGYRALHRYTPHDPLSLEEPELVAALLALVTNKAERSAARYFGIRNLTRYQHPDIQDTLRDLLRDPLPLVRYAAAESLTTHGDADSVADLVACLEDPEANVRASAAHTLAALGGDMAIRPLLELRDDEDEVVRYAACRALDAIGKRKKIGALLRQA